jgi:uncharacterized protein YuzE
VTSLEVDGNVNAAYLTLADLPVARTVEITPAVQVDLSDTGEVVGVEFLDLAADVPLGLLLERVRLSPSQLDAVIQARLTLRSFTKVTSSELGFSGANTSDLQPV